MADRKRAEKEPRKSEEKFRTLFEQAALGMGRVRFTDAQWVDANEALCRMLGYTREEICSMRWPQLTHPEDVELDMASFRRMAAGELETYTVEKRFIHKDGHLVWARLTLSLIRDEEGLPEHLIAIIENITERVKATEALRKQARLINLAPTATLVRRLDGTITFWSDGAAKLYGWTHKEAIGRRTHDLLRTEFPEPLEAVVEILRRKGKWSGELRQIARDESRLVVESHWLGQFTPQGEVIELMESNMDITQRKRAVAELRRLQSQLESRVEQRTSDLAAANKELESLAYSVSHDLRAPLRHIDSYLNLLGTSPGCSFDEEGRKFLRIVTDAARRMGGLIDDLLTVLRLGRARLDEQPVDLGRVVEAARLELAPAMANRQIEWRIGPLPRVNGDHVLLSSAVTNLLSNAIKYTRHRTPAVIEVGSKVEHAELICFVRDNGAGFDMRFTDKLFGVFQRLHTATEFEGSGIGLASVRQVILRHGGRTWAEGQPGRGATFYFSLPLSRLRDTNP